MFKSHYSLRIQTCLGMALNLNVCGQVKYNLSRTFIYSDVVPCCVLGLICQLGLVSLELSIYISGIDFCNYRTSDLTGCQPTSFVLVQTSKSQLQAFSFVWDAFFVFEISGLKILLSPTPKHKGLYVIAIFIPC